MVLEKDAGNLIVTFQLRQARQKRFKEIPGDPSHLGTKSTYSYRVKPHAKLARSTMTATMIKNSTSWLTTTLRM
jgi:hypothetical protein